MTRRPALYRSTGIGTRIEILVTDSGGLVEAAGILVREVQRLDEVASRFRADSELTRLNAASGSAVPVSEDLFELLVAALWVARATDGAVDPTVGRAMIGLGYDRDFDLLAGGVEDTGPAEGAPGWRTVELDGERRSVRVPRGALLDLGASAKAFAADRIAARAAARIGCGVLVALGGDVAVAGEPPPGGFALGVDDGAPGAPGTVAIRSGGVATSGISARRWRRGPSFVHHIVDPATGLSSATPWRVVSVAAASCLEANAASTAAVVKGLGAPGWLAERRLPARLVGRDARVRTVGGWPDDGPGEPQAVAVGP